MSKSSSNHQHKLGWFLCWAVVFADIGTSLYYVPGILFGEVGNLAGLFTLLTSVVFILLVIKYIEITDRYSEGGGVVTVATDAFGPWIGVLGGMFIVVDYYLTASISSVSGFAYLNSILNLGEFILVAAIIGIVLLGILNIIGIQESAKVTAVVAIAALIVDIVLVAFVATQVGPDGWETVFGSLGQIKTLSPISILTGFAGAFLAFSGLESISQLSPAMSTPRKKIAGIAMGLVVVAILTTSPLLTLFSTNLLNAKAEGSNETILETVTMVKEREEQLLHTTDQHERAELEEQIEAGKVYSERFMSELGAQYGGKALKVAVVITASILLLFASNTAIIGAYHVFITLSRNKFLPAALSKYNSRFGTPHWAVALAIVPPILIILATQGDLTLLGQLYAFGLLGAFVLTSIGLDVVRWREQKKISISFVLGLITSAAVLVAWVTNLYFKSLATLFGGIITIAGMMLAYYVHSKLSKETVKPEFAKEEMEQLGDIPAGQIFVPIFTEFNFDAIDDALFHYVGDYAAKSGKGVTIMCVRVFNDILQTVSEDIEQDTDAANFLRKAVTVMQKYNVPVYEMYQATDSAALAVNSTRDKIKPILTIITPHQQSAIMDFLRGDAIEKIISHKDGNVLIYTGAK